MKKNRSAPRYGRLRGGAARAFGPLSIEFLIDAGRAGPLTAMRVAMKPRASHPPLWHERTSEFFVVLKGGMTARIGAKSRRFRAGDYAFLPPGTLHAFRAGARGVEVLSTFVPGLNMRRPDIIYKK